MNREPAHPTPHRFRWVARAAGALAIGAVAVHASCNRPRDTHPARAASRPGALATTTERRTVTLQITSTAFSDGSDIPPRYTCDGEDISPPLAWHGAPAGTRSYALIVDDPDAPDPAHPKMTYVHWVLYDIPGEATGLAENAGAPGGAGLPAGTRVGANDWKRAQYGGPCPPIGRHRYFFKLYALDAPLRDMGGGGSATKADVERAMQGHVLAQAQVMGTYQKRGAAGGA